MATWQNFGDQLRNSGAGRWFYGRDRSEQRIILIIGSLVLVLLLLRYLPWLLSSFRLFELAWLRSRGAKSLFYQPSTTPCTTVCRVVSH